MATTKVISHEDISEKEFNELLSQYPALIETISQSKSVKDGQRTLPELDQYRYIDALKIFGREKPQREMNLDDVKELVEWKLRHGKFRPTLMSLVSSNSTTFTSQTIQSALKTYHSNNNSKSDNVSAALDTLTKLKGIGPATASLLLTVHDPTNIIFFSDEAFYWLCCQGKKHPIKYNPKEYLALRTEAEGLAKRLNVSATDIEKVAYVLMKQPEPLKGAKNSSTSAGKKPKKASGSVPSGKRKAASGQYGIQKEDDAKEENAVEENANVNKVPVRRSKRLRK